MATGDYVTPAELDVALNELNKKLESRLYTIKGDLLGRMGSDGDTDGQREGPSETSRQWV